MPLMTPAKAATELGISGRQLRDLTADGAIPYIDGKREAGRYEPSDTAKPPASKVYDIREILAKAKAESGNGASVGLLEPTAFRRRLCRRKRSCLGLLGRFRSLASLIVKGHVGYHRLTPVHLGKAEVEC